jgi:hypothetical protein
VDLGLVRTGRAPLLVEHTRSVDCLLGAVVSAESDGNLLRSLVRFGRGQRGRPLSEAGGRLPAQLRPGRRDPARDRTATARTGGAATTTVDRWRSTDSASVVVSAATRQRTSRGSARDDGRGRDGGAHGGGRAGEPRAAVRRALHLDAWERWARRTGPKLGVELGLETDTICDALEREVAGALRPARAGPGGVITPGMLLPGRAGVLAVLQGCGALPPPARLAFLAEAHEGRVNRHGFQAMLAQAWKAAGWEVAAAPGRGSGCSGGSPTPTSADATLPWLRDLCDRRGCRRGPSRSGAAAAASPPRSPPG